MLEDLEVHRILTDDPREETAEMKRRASSSDSAHSSKASTTT